MPDISNANLRRLDLSQLLVFDAVLAYRNFTRAAEKLNMTQSAVSQAVARLRDIFDDPLFIRLQVGVQPTERALALAPQISQVLQLSDQMLQRAHNFDPAELSQTLAISMWDYETAVLAPSLVARLGEKAPDLRLSIRPMIRAQAKQALRLGEIDLALGRFSALEPQFLAHGLKQETFKAITRKGLLGKNPVLSLAAYTSARHLLVSWEGDLVGSVDHLLKARNLPPRKVTVALPSFQAAFPMVVGSDLIATLPTGLVEMMRTRYEIDVFELPFEMAGFQLDVVQHVRSAHDPVLIWVIELLKELCSN